MMCLKMFVPAGLACTLLLTAAPVQAQFGGIKPTGVNAAFLQLFGPHTTFTAKADVQVLDKDGKDWVRVPANFSALDQKLRMEIDLGQVVSRDLPEFAINSLKQSGLSQVVSIVRTDRKATFLIYPGVESYLNLPLPPEDAATMQKGYKVETKSAGTEKLAGKDRVRNDVAVKEPTGTTVLQATTWTAPELKNFPVQIETRQDKMTIVLKFTDVQFAKPAASQFDVPAGYTEYKDMQKMMFSIMKKVASGAAGS